LNKKVHSKRPCGGGIAGGRTTCQLK